MKQIVNINKIMIDKKWITLGIQIGKERDLMYGPYAGSLAIQIHLFIIHIRLGIAYNRGLFKNKKRKG